MAAVKYPASEEPRGQLGRRVSNRRPPGRQPDVRRDGGFDGCAKAIPASLAAVGRACQ